MYWFTVWYVTAISLTSSKVIVAKDNRSCNSWALPAPGPWFPFSTIWPATNFETDLKLCWVYTPQSNARQLVYWRVLHFVYSVWGSRELAWVCAAWIHQNLSFSVKGLSKGLFPIVLRCSLCCHAACAVMQPVLRCSLCWDAACAVMRPFQIQPHLITIYIPLFPIICSHYHQALEDLLHVPNIFLCEKTFQREWWALLIVLSVCLTLSIPSS